MKLLAWTALAAFVALPAGVAAQTADKSMTVFVTAAAVQAVEKPDKETEKRLKAVIEDAKTRRKELEKQLKAQHGNKRENWPQDAQDRYYDAEEAQNLAEADWDYRRVKPEGLSDTAEDIKKSIAGDGVAGKKENITLVSSPDQAQLIVKVVGRRSSKTLPTQLRADMYYVSFTIEAGPQLPAARFAAAPRDYRFKRFGYAGWRLQIPRPESPAWRFESYGSDRWGAAANVASIVVEDFIAKNHAAMNAPTTR